MTDNDSKPKSQHREYDDLDHDPSPPFDVFQSWSHSHSHSHLDASQTTLQSYSSSLLSHVNHPEQAGPGPGIYGASLAVGEQWHFGPIHGQAGGHRPSSTNYPGTQPWVDRDTVLPTSRAAGEERDAKDASPSIQADLYAGPWRAPTQPTSARSPVAPPASSNMEWPSSYITAAEQAPQRNQRRPQGLDGFIFDHVGPDHVSSPDPSFSFPTQLHDPSASNLSTQGGQLLTFYGCQPLNADSFGWPENDDSAFDAVTAAALLSAQFSPSPTPAPTPAPRTQRSVSASSSGSPSNSPACATPTHLDRSQGGPSPSLEVIQWQFDTSGSTSRKRSGSALDDTATGAVSRTLKKKDFQDKSGKFEGTMMTLGNPQHRRARFTAQQKAETRLARVKGGVCAHCQRLKRKCDLTTKGSEYEPCTRCCSTTRGKAMSMGPCFKSILSDILFFREGPAANEPLFTIRFKQLSVVDISNLNVPVRNLRLTQRIGNHVLTVYAAEFTPIPGDKVELHWKDSNGDRQRTKMPAFCLTNIPKVTAQIQEYIKFAKREYLESLKKDDPLVSRTVKMAMEYADARPCSIPAMALDLWAISRMIEIEWEMCGRPGEDTLGVERISDRTNPRKGKIPIPPMMDTQLDQIVIAEVLEPLKKKILEEFEAKVALNHPEDWFEIYLSSFIILNHIERLAKHSAFHARLHAMPTRFSNTQFLERAFHAAKVILSRFHFVCKGSVPLLLDWDSPSTRSLAKLDTAQLNFMKETQALIKAKGNEVSTLRTTYSYENPLYWSSQLFDENWDNSPARVIELPRVLEAA